MSKEQKKYCIFSANYLPHLGGIENFTANLAKQLVTDGYKVSIVTNNTCALDNYEILDFGADIYRLPCISLFSGRLPLPLLNRSFFKTIHSIQNQQWSGFLINARFYLHSLIGVLVAKRCGIRAIVCDHGSAHITFGNRLIDIFTEAWEHFITFIIKHYDVVFYAVSNSSAEWLRHFGIKCSGILSNSIDAASFRSSKSNRNFHSEFSIPDRDLLISFIGRLIPEKGVPFLLESFDSLSSLPISFVIAGDGPLAQAVISKQSDKVYYVGRLNQPDIAALLIESDLYCLPSRSEGFSTSLLEASACGTPSLVTRVGGADELIPSKDFGIVITEPMTCEVLIEYIYRIFRNRDLLPVMGENARILVEQNYSWKETSNTFVHACLQANN